MTRISDNMENTSSSPTHDEPQEQIEVKSDQPHGLSTPIPAVHSLCPETSPLSATYTSIVVPELINSTSWKGIQKQSPMKLTNLPTATPTSFQWENIFNKCDHSNPQSPYSNSGQLEGDHFTGAIAYGNSAYVPPTFSKISVQRDTEDIPHSKLINGINNQFRCPNLSVKSAGYQQSINSDRWDGVYKNLEKPTICQSSRSPVVGQNLATHTGADSDQGCLFQPDMSIGNTMNGNTMYYPGSTPTGTPMPNTFCPLVPPTVGYTTPAFLNDDIFNEEQEHPNLLPYPAWNTNGMNFRTHNSHGVELSTSRRRNATRESTATLKSWLQEHIKNPYPTKGEKIMLAIITKMTLTQVSTWFANARRRLKKENKMTWTPKHRNEELQEDDDEDIDAEMSDSGENLPTGKSADSKEPTLRGSDRQNFLNGDLEECSTDISYSVSSCSKSSGDGKLGQTIPMSEDIGKVFYPYHRYEAQLNQPASPRTEHTSESPTSKRTFQSLVDSSGTESTRNMYRNDQFSSLQSIAKANSQIPGYNNLSENEKRNSMDETSPALWMPYTSDFVPSQSKVSSFDVERTIKWSTSFMEQATEDRGPLLKTDSLQSDIGIFGPIPHPDFTCAYPTLPFSNNNTSSRLSQITPQSVSIPPPWVWRHNPQPFIIPSSTANDVNKLVEPASSERLSPWGSSGGNQFRLSPQAAINEFHRPNWENVLHSKEGMAALKTLPQNDSRRPEDNSRLNFLNDTYSLDLLHQNGVKTPEPTASSLTTLQTFSPFHPYAEASFPLPSQI